MIDNRCERTNCYCTHSDGCERGWIHVKYSHTTRHLDRQGNWHKKVTWYDGVQPCAICDPERARIFEQAKSSKELGELLRNRSTHKKQAAYEEQEFNKTRTL